MKQVILLLGFSLATIIGYAQSIQNLNASFADGKVTVVYDLVGANPSRTYSLDLYSSHNNFSSPVKNVAGDVGINITEGIGKKIIWDATAELDSFSGQVTFKVKGEMTPLAFAFKSPITGSAARRGKNLNIQWEGGRLEQEVRFEILNGIERVIDLGETKNAGQYTWHIPKDFAKGSYSVKLIAGQEIKQSESFKVKSRTPLLIKVLPFLVVGGVAAVLVSGDGGEKTNNNLPVAPDPTGN